MEPLSPRTAALAGGAFLAALAAAVWLFSPILLPFVAGIALAYLLDPLVDRCERAGLGRGISTTLVLAGTILVAAAGALLLLPVVLDQGASLARHLPLLVERASALAAEGLRAAGQEGAGGQPALVEAVLARLGEWAPEAVERVFRSAAALVNLFGLLVVTPVVTWYLLRDWDVLVERVDSLLPLSHAERIRARFREIHEALSSFVRGQSAVCAILAAYYAAALGLIGVPNGVFIGLFAGIVSFVPYAGTVIGVGLAVGLSWLAFGLLAWQTAAAAAVFLAGQACEEYLLRPRIIGERVGLHPVWTVFALFAGASLFGFVGILLAVPAAAAIAVLLRAGVASYRASRLYGGGGA